MCVREGVDIWKGQEIISELCTYCFPYKNIINWSEITFYVPLISLLFSLSPLIDWMVKKGNQ